MPNPRFTSSDGYTRLDKVNAIRRWLATRLLEGDITVADVDRLVDLLDVLLTNPQVGDSLQYDGSKWINNKTRPYINDTESGIVVNRAGGFQSAWEVFDLLGPGVGYGKATITAADGDTLVWGVDISPVIIVDVSVDNSTWIGVYNLSTAQPGVMLLRSFGTNPNPVGDYSQYSLFTPRAIRFSVAITDVTSGLIYNGLRNPSLAFTFEYTAG